jgi:hypothetical protein
MLTPGSLFFASTGSIDSDTNGSAERFVVGAPA